MPTFPTYYGELPPCLSPLKLRHYLLLAYWIYFRPTALKCYLYQADPEAYQIAEPGLRNVGKLWRAKAWRNLWLMIPGQVVLCLVLVGIPLVFMATRIQGTTPLWGIMVFSVALGVAGGVAGGVAFGVAGGVARGIAFGVVGSVAVGLALGVWGGALGGDVVGGVVIGVIHGVAFGVGIGVAFGVAFGVVVGVTIDMTAGVVSILAGILAFGVVFDVTASTAYLVGVALGVLRVVFYLPTFAVALRDRANAKSSHPAEWDELAVLPLPWAERTIASRLADDRHRGLGTTTAVARNPFQRWSAQRGLHGFIHATSRPLHLLYAILSEPTMEDFIAPPTIKRQWRDFPMVKQVLLGELGGLWVDGSGGTSRSSERLVWALTRRLRNQQQSPLTRFAAMLYEITDEAVIEADRFDLHRYDRTFGDIKGYAGGPEIATSFAALSTCLSCTSLSCLRSAGQDSDHVVQEPEPIRPAVLAALSRLGDVAAEVATFQASTSRVNKLAALGRATASLDDLDEFVAQKVLPPEQFLLRRIIRQWRRLISEAGGEVGRLQIAGPVANPYVLNNPVRPPLFQGREDVLRRLEELWSGEGQKPSVVFYGHRRMGKSSILQNLGEGARFGKNTLIVDFNMQRVGHVDNTGELLHNLALALTDSLPFQPRQTWKEPDEESFLAHNPYTAFERFLRQLDRVRDGHRFIILVDEFELIEQAIKQKGLEPKLLDFWRGLIQTYPWFIMAFAGLHTLQEMTKDYWHPLFGSVTAVSVSFLSSGAARQLITNPAPDFAIDYEEDAIEAILALTNGQPYLVQLIGHGLVTRLNRQTYDEGVERERRFSLADVEAIIKTSELFRDGLAYFQGVWAQAESDSVPGQPATLSALAPYETGLAPDEIARLAALSLVEIHRALEALKGHDVVAEQDGLWRFTVELMRRWVVQTHPARSFHSR